MKKTLIALKDETNIRTLLSIALLMLLASCATVPQEAVELSNTVGRDLEEVHRAHKAIANKYFDLLEDDAIRYVDEVFTPKYIQAVAQDVELDKTVAGLTAQAPHNLLPYLVHFVDNVIGEIEKTRQMLLQPLQTRRKEIMRTIDEAHSRIQAAQATVSAHLASVRRVHDAQNEMYKEVGLDGLRDMIAKNVAEASEKLNDLVKKGEQANATLDDMEKLSTDLKTYMEQMKQ